MGYVVPTEGDSGHLPSLFLHCSSNLRTMCFGYWERLVISWKSKSCEQSWRHIISGPETLRVGVDFTFSGGGCRRQHGLQERRATSDFVSSVGIQVS